MVDDARSDAFGAALRAEAAELAPAIAAALRDAMATVDERLTLPPGADAALGALDVPLPETGPGSAPTLRRLRELIEAAGANTNGPRAFHFVIGGTTPAALGADLLATIHDTLTYTWITSPLGVTLELQALAWLRELLALPPSWSGVMVTGASMANFVALATARQWWGERHGVDVSERGLSGLPPMPVFSSGYVHASTRKVLSLLGCGRDTVTLCARDEVGRLDLAALRRGLERLGGAPALVVVNAGEVNAGDFDPIAEAIEIARRHDCWVHVDGAFGLFARVSPRTEHLVRGAEGADSATVDGHKWLNVPYDSGIVICRDAAAHRASMTLGASYYVETAGGERDPYNWVPESSRRARGFPIYAALRSLGRSGLANMIDHCCALARRMADQLRGQPGVAILNDVVLNQVLVRFSPPGGGDVGAPEAGDAAAPEAGDAAARADEFTRRVIAAVQADGTCWAGGTTWHGMAAMRISVSNWSTTEADVDMSVEAILRCAREVGAS